jgi:hypothetical protein
LDDGGGGRSPTDNESHASIGVFFVERILVEATAKTKKPLKIKGFFFF